MGIGKAAALGKITQAQISITIMAETHKDLSTKDFELEVGRFLQKVYFDLNEKKFEEQGAMEIRPAFQSMDSMLIELDRLEELSQIIVQRGLTTALEGAKIAIEWALNLHETGRDRQVADKRFLLDGEQRREIVGKQRYEQLKEMRLLREERNEQERERFN